MHQGSWSSWKARREEGLAVADRIILDNPFVKHESHHRNTLITYQVLSVLSWALVVVAGIYYSIRKPHDVKHGHTIWKQAERHHTPFSQNVYITGIFWSVPSFGRLIDVT